MQGSLEDDDRPGTDTQEKPDDAEQALFVGLNPQVVR